MDNFLVVKPKPDDFAGNTEYLRSLGGIYVPERKCWVVEAEEDLIAEEARVFGKFEAKSVARGPSLIAMIDKCADFRSW
jgi:hypothetical protein